MDHGSCIMQRPIMCHASYWNFEAFLGGLVDLMNFWIFFSTQGVQMLYIVIFCTMCRAAQHGWGWWGLYPTKPEKFISLDLKDLISYLGQILTYWTLVFCKHPHFHEEWMKRYKQNHKILYRYNVCIVHSCIFAQQSNQYARCLMRPCRACFVYPC